MIQASRIDDASIAQALDPKAQTSITSMLFWNCACEYPMTHVHNRTMLMCEDCGTLRDNSPDSRIADIRDAGIHINWTHPQVKRTLQIPQRTEPAGLTSPAQ